MASMIGGGLILRMSRVHVRIRHLYRITSNGSFTFTLLSFIDLDTTVAMLTTSLSTLALPLAFSVLSTRALSMPLQEDLQQPPEFRSVRLETQSRTHSTSLITRDANHTKNTLIDIINESDMEVWSYLVHSLSASIYLTRVVCC